MDIHVCPHCRCAFDDEGKKIVKAKLDAEAKTERCYFKYRKANSWYYSNFPYIAFLAAGFMLFGVTFPYIRWGEYQSVMSTLTIATSLFAIIFILSVQVMESVWRKKFRRENLDQAEFLGDGILFWQLS